jgi:hypothetical protein
MLLMDHYQWHGHELTVQMSSVDALEQVTARVLVPECITLRYIHYLPSVDFMALFYVPSQSLLPVPRRHHAILVKNNHRIIQGTSLADLGTIG